MLLPEGPGSSARRSCARCCGEGAAKVVVIDNLLTGHEAEPGRGARVASNSIAPTFAIMRRSRRCIRGADVVFHEAAIPSVPRSIDDPVPSHEVNIDGTFQRAAGGARGRGAAAWCMPRRRPPTATRRYCRRSRPCCRVPSRRMRCRNWSASITATSSPTCFGLETVALRYFNVYGPRQDPSSPYSGRAVAVHEGGAGAPARPPSTATASSRAISPMSRMWLS